MPCPNNPFAHTEGVGMVGIEVKWSCKKNSRGIKTSYYFGCGICKSQIFLNTWEESWGYTLPQAEAMGMTLIDLNSTRKDQLLKELGLQRAPQQPPPGFRPPAPAGYRQPPRKTKK
jgi:hypothetical protein